MNRRCAISSCRSGVGSADVSGAFTLTNLTIRSLWLPANGSRAIQGKLAMKGTQGSVPDSCVHCTNADQPNLSCLVTPNKKRIPDFQETNEYPCNCEQVLPSHEHLG